MTINLAKAELFSYCSPGPVFTKATPSYWHKDAHNKPETVVSDEQANRQVFT